MTIGKDAYDGYAAAGKDEGVFPLPEGVRALEIGFGTGKLLEALRSRGNDVYGADAGANLVEAARAKGFENILHLDISEEPLPWPDDFFDAVYAYEVFEHLTNPHRLFYEVRRVLKRDAYFYFSVPCQEIDMGYGLGLHPFVYPGLLLREHLERFIMQMYFRVDGYHESGLALNGRSYKLCNRKDPAKDDIVYVVPRSNNVRTLYGDLISPEALWREIDREVYRMIQVAHHHTDRGDVAQVRECLRHCVAEYPEFYPLYPEFAHLFLRLGLRDLAAGLLDVVRKRPMTPEVEGMIRRVEEELAASSPE